MELLLFPDLAVSKKAQRAKDWPMLRRLVEVNYLTFREEAEETSGRPLPAGFSTARPPAPSPATDCVIPRLSFRCRLRMAHAPNWWAKPGRTPG